MVIRFLCPNGHKVHCGDDQAGKPAKCPQCGTRFLVPESAGESVTGGASETTRGNTLGKKGPASGSNSSVDLRGLTTMTTPGSSGVGRPKAEEEIEFLCPNGHRLHGPARLQGKAGQCPECGSRFRVPSYEEVPEDSAVAPSAEPAIRLLDRNESNAIPEAVSDGSNGARRQGEGAAKPQSPGSDFTGTAANIRGLFLRLWEEKAQGAAIVVFLPGGGKIVPNYFYPQASQGPQAVFANDEPDGTITVTTVAWHTIERVQVRGLKKVPEHLK
jgi:DNA-directed RNA polymerase subunit RPC12/RpoP